MVLITLSQLRSYLPHSAYVFTLYCAVHSPQSPIPTALQSTTVVVKSGWSSWILTRKRQLVFWLIALVAVVLATHWIDLRVERYLGGERGKIVSGAWGD